MALHKPKSSCKAQHRGAATCQQFGHDLTPDPLSGFLGKFHTGGLLGLDGLLLRLPGSPEHEAQAELPSQSIGVDCRNRTHASWLVLHSCRVRFAQATVLVSNDTMGHRLGFSPKAIESTVTPSQDCLFIAACVHHQLLVIARLCWSAFGEAQVLRAQRNSTWCVKVVDGVQHL